jgi:hypothetical protein
LNFILFLLNLIKEQSFIDTVSSVEYGEYYNITVKYTFPSFSNIYTVLSFDCADIVTLNSPCFVSGAQFVSIGENVNNFHSDYLEKQIQFEYSLGLLEYYYETKVKIDLGIVTNTSNIIISFLLLSKSS